MEQQVKRSPFLCFLVIIGIACAGCGKTTRLAENWVIGETAVDENCVYGATLSGIQRVDKGGKRPVTLVPYSSENFEERQYPPGRIALDRDHVYWTQEHAPIGQYAVKRVLKEGGAPESFFRVEKPEFENPIGLAVDEENIYVLSFGPTSSSSIDWILDPLSSNYKGGALVKIPKSSGVPEVLISGLQAPRDLAMDETGLYWTEHGSYIEKFSHESDFVYQGDGAVKKIPKTGGAALTLASRQDGPSVIKVDGKEIYWMNQGHYDHHNWTEGQGIISSLRPDKPVVHSAPPPWNLKSNFVLSPHFIYFQGVEFYGSPGLYGRPSHKYLLRIPRSGGAEQIIYRSDHDILSLTSFANDLFWLEGVRGDVRRMKEPPVP